MNKEKSPSNSIMEEDALNSTHNVWKPISATRIHTNSLSPFLNSGNVAEDNAMDDQSEDVFGVNQQHTTQLTTNPFSKHAANPYLSQPSQQCMGSAKPS